MTNFLLPDSAFLPSQVSDVPPRGVRPVRAGRWSTGRIACVLRPQIGGPHLIRELLKEMQHAVPFRSMVSVVDYHL